MPTTADYLNNLLAQRDNLADNLVAKGVTASKTELLDTLVPKILDIEGDSGKAKLNIFTQMNEPEGKEGIWLKTDIPHEKVVFDRSAYLAETMVDSQDFPTFSLESGVELRLYMNGLYIYKTGNSFYFYDMETKTSSLINTIVGITLSTQYGIDIINKLIYYVGKDSSDYYIVEKLNLTDNVITRLVRHSDIYGIGYYLASPVGKWSVYGDNIYMMRNGVYSADVYKTNLIDLTQTVIWSTGISSFKAKSETTLFANESYVYLVYHKWDSTFLRRIWYFASLNLSTGSGSPKEIARSEASEGNSEKEVRIWGYEVVANDVYFFLGKRKYTNIVNQFDSVDLTRVRLNTPSSFSTPTTIYSYGTLRTDVLNRKAENLIYDPINNFILDVGYYQEYRATHVYALTSTQYSDKAIILIRNSTNIGGTYYTELASAKDNIEIVYNGRICIGFLDVFYYYNGSLKSIETYYGNGSSWVKIK